MNPAPGRDRRADDPDLDDEGVRESPGRAMAQIGIGAVVFGALAGAYLWNANRSHEAALLVVDARPMVEQADVTSLKSAEEQFLKVLEIKSSDEKGLAGLAEVYTHLWLLHGLEEYEAKAKEYIGIVSGDNIQRAERYAAEALVAYHEGRYDDSINVAKDVLDKGGVSERLNWTLGLSLRGQGKVKIGRDNLRKAQDSRSGAPHYAVALGDAYEEDGDNRNSRHYWTLAKNANSNYIIAAAREFMARSRRGEPVEKLAPELKTLSKTDPALMGKQDQAAIELARSEFNYRRGKTKEALSAAKKAIKVGGETAMRHYARAKALLAEGKTAKGLAAIEEARKKAPNALRYYYAAAEALSDAGKHAEAIKVLNEQKEKLIQDPTFHVALGEAWAAKGDFKKAGAAYDAALKINETWPEALLGQGVIFWKQKKYDDATKWLEKAVNARRKFPEVYETIGLMWVEQGAASQADPQLQEAEKIYKARGMDAVAMNAFYARVIKTLAAHRARSQLSAWANREKEFRKSI